MKAVGIVRKLDTLGRIVIPMELRRSFDLKIGDPIEIFVEDGSIILRKYQTCCVFCGEDDGVSKVHGKNVCKACLDKIKAYPSL